jgi:hypothetical protein
MVSSKDIAWVAGILEGEGSFQLTNEGRSPRIALSMTDKDIIERFRSIVDNTLTITIASDKRKETYKDNYRLTVNGSLAVEWMMTVYCLMGIRRRAKIKEILDIWKTIKLRYSQIRTMRPAARLVETMMSVGLTREQALAKIREITVKPEKE